MKGNETSKNKSTPHIPLVVGLGLMLLLAAFAYLVPVPSSWQQGILLTILALAAAGIAAIIPGFIEIQYKGWLRAGGAIAVFCIVYFFKPQPSAADQSFSLTVLVHGTDGKQDIVLENKGHLIIDLGDDRRKALIGDLGRTVFSGIPGKLRNQHISIGLDADGFEPGEPNKEYPLDDKPIYFTVTKTGDTLSGSPQPGRAPQQPKTPDVKNCTVVGIVKDKTTDKGVSQAKITIICGDVFQTESSSDGSFRLPVPGNLKKEQCLIRAEYKGKSKEAYVPLCDPNPVELRIE